MREIVKYIEQTYEPLAILIYGSYADGSNNQNSDFDALVISKSHKVFHDVSFVNGIQLDVFVYPMVYFERAFDCGDFIQLYDSKIILDVNGRGQWLKKQVVDHVDSISNKTPAEIKTQIEWCRKMFQRTKRCDTEGMFRWHWVLVDSLEIFCDAVGHMYWGPKKTLRWMEDAYPEGFAYYKKALNQFETDCLEQWILYLEQLNADLNTSEPSNP